MRAREIKIDPTTNDLVRDGRGGFVYADGAETAILHAIRIHFGGDWYLPGDGSRLHDHQALLGADVDDVASELTRALTPLVTRLRISNVSVIPQPSSVLGRFDLSIHYTDARTGRAGLVTFTPQR